MTLSSLVLLATIRNSLHDNRDENGFGAGAAVYPVQRFPFPRRLHPLERAAVNPVISSGPCVPCMQRAATRWGGSVNTALQGAHMSTF